MIFPGAPVGTSIANRSCAEPCPPAILRANGSFSGGQVRFAKWARHEWRAWWEVWLKCASRMRAGAGRMVFCSQAVRGCGAGAVAGDRSGSYARTNPTPPRPLFTVPNPALMEPAAYSQWVVARVRAEMIRRRLVPHAGPEREGLGSVVGDGREAVTPWGWCWQCGQTTAKHRQRLFSFAKPDAP